MAIDTTQLEVKETAIKLFSNPAILEKFKAILGGGTSAYIQSALICIADNPKLMECTPKSLIKSTLRSATLGLSLDPALRQGFIIPRWDKKAKAQVASFQPHYNGLYQLAQRTGKYRAINVSPIHEGEQVFEDVRTGLHVYRRNGYNTVEAPNNQISGLNDGYRDVTSGKNKGRIIGYLAYFKTMDGLEKSVWMTIEEIHEHAQKWAPENYNSDYGAWKDEKKRPTMEMKTVFLQLTKFMDLSGERSVKLRAAIEADARQDEADDAEEVIDATPTPMPLEVESKVPAPMINKPVEFASTKSQWAIQQAATAWNLSLTEAAQQLARKGLPDTMTKAAFIDAINA